MPQFEFSGNLLQYPNLDSFYNFFKLNNEKQKELSSVKSLPSVPIQTNQQANQNSTQPLVYLRAEIAKETSKTKSSLSRKSGDRKRLSVTFHDSA